MQEVTHPVIVKKSPFNSFVICFELYTVDSSSLEIGVLLCLPLSLPFLLWCALHLQEEVEPLKEHPVEAGEVEEVGEGEGGAEQGLRKVGRHLKVVKVVSMVDLAKKIKVAKVVKMSKTVLEDEPGFSKRE